MHTDCTVPYFEILRKVTFSLQFLDQNDINPQTTLDDFQKTFTKHNSNTEQPTVVCSRPQCTYRGTLSPKNVFSEKKIKKKNFFLPFFNATFQCGRYGVCKKKFKILFDPEKVKKRASKVAHNQPRLFFPQSSPGHSPQPKIDFPYHEISGQDICSYLWFRGSRLGLVVQRSRIQDQLQ